MRQLDEPGAVLRLLVRGGVVGGLHQVDGSGDVAVKLAQVRGAGEPGNIAGPQVEHPLHGLHGVGVVAEFRVGVGQVAVDGDVVRRALVESGGGFEGPGELVAAEQQPRLHLEALEVAGRDFERLAERLFGFGVVAHVGDFTRAPGIGHGEVVVVGVVVRVRGDQVLRFADADFSGAGRHGGAARDGDAGENECVSHVHSPTEWGRCRQADRCSRAVPVRSASCRAR